MVSAEPSNKRELGLDSQSQIEGFTLWFPCSIRVFSGYSSSSDTIKLQSDKKVGKISDKEE